HSEDGLVQGEVELVRELLEPAACERFVERESASEETSSEAPADQVHVRHRDVRPSFPIGDRTGIRSRTRRSDAQRPARIDPGYAPTAGADRFDVDPGNGDREGAEHGVRPPGRLASGEGREVRTRAAHVEGHEISPGAPTQNGCG